MKRLGTTVRIGFVMTAWSATVLLGLHLFQVFDEGHETILDSRTRLCEAVAVSCSQLASHNDREGMLVVLSSFVKRDGNVLSARFRQPEAMESDIAELTVGEHDQHWRSTEAHYQTAGQIAVPVFCGDRPCGNLEVAFRSPVGAAILGFIRLPSPQLTLLTSSLNLLIFSIWMRHCFRQPVPSHAVPDESRSAFDAGNRGGLNRLPDTPGSLPPMQEPYQLIDKTRGGGLFLSFRPILETLNNANRLAGGNFSAESNRPFVDEDGDEERIGKTLERLKASQQEIEEQNRHLTYLATRDPMTGCLNRRSFFEHFDELWRSSKRYGHPLSCVMVDVDHFKMINDEHGHQVGDQVLEQVASALKRTARDTDFVCRYGGEEFCILLPHVDLAGAWIAAERFREAIESLKINSLTVTASLGCSDREQGAATAEQLLNQADQALYCSKRNGRNRATPFDRILSSKLEDSATAPEQVAAHAN